MNQAIEYNVLTVMIKIRLWEFNLYWKFMCTDEKNDRNKETSPLPPLQLQFSLFLKS